MKRILLIDDEEDNISILELTFEDFDEYELVCFTDPLEGYKYLVDNPVDLILLDWMMPAMTGIEFLDRMKSDNIRTKVVMATGRTMDHEKETAIEHGVDDFLSKPFSIEELLESVKKHL